MSKGIKVKKRTLYLSIIAIAILVGGALMIPQLIMNTPEENTGEITSN